MRGPREGIMGLARRGYLSISEAYEKIVATLGPHARPSDDYLLSLDEDERDAALTASSSTPAPRGHEDAG
jgi:hypothetical protein